MSNATVMERMMDKMPPSDRRTMMQDMMGQMVGGMTADERLAFMHSMMQTCLPMLTEGLDVTERTRMVRDIMGTLAPDTQRTDNDGQDS